MTIKTPAEIAKLSATAKAQYEKDLAAYNAAQAAELEAITEKENKLQEFQEGLEPSAGGLALWEDDFDNATVINHGLTKKNKRKFATLEDPAGNIFSALMENLMFAKGDKVSIADKFTRSNGGRITLSA